MTAIDEDRDAISPERRGGSRVRGRERAGRLPKPFFRFNLMALLLALFAVTIYFGVRQRFAVSREENQAKQELRDLHASYTLRPAHPAWVQYVFLQVGEEAQHVDSVDFPPYFPDVNDARKAKRLTAQDLAALARLPHLRKVDLSQTMFDETALGALMHNRELEELILSETLIGEDGVRRLAGHPTLSIVRLDRTLTSDASLKTLARLPDLTEISLDDATTEEGIAALAKAPKLKKVDASLTALLSAELEPLAKREILIGPAPTRRYAQNPPPDEDRFREFGRRKGVRWVEVEARHLTAPRFLAYLEQAPHVEVVNVHHDDTIDPDDLSSLLALPQILEIYLDLAGSPIPHGRIEDVAKRLRPADASPCIVYGNVLITGEELVHECAKVRQVDQLPASPVHMPYHAPYVIKDLRSEHFERLTDLADSTYVAVQPHASGLPNRWVVQSSLLNKSSGIFVQIPLP
ncbi:MAG TPA: hypothetical protein VGN57_21765 [Pirellulaceae bacterium]|jgi:hypothetical protein|nr:hypothetical protein [Pirellulaceae bacterium]